MPDWFNEDETLKWMELVQDLRELGILSDDNREILVAYCTAHGGWIKARRMIEKTGLALIVKQKDGTIDMKRNPYCVELHKFRDEMNRLLPEFGLTPSSRQKLVSLKPVEDDPFLELLALRSLPRN